MDNLVSIVKLKNHCLNLGFTEPVLVMERTFHASLFDNATGELLIPRNQATRLEGHVNQFQTRVARLIGPYLEYVVTVRLFDGLHFALGVGFEKMGRDHRLTLGKRFQLWYFLGKSAAIAFGIVPITDPNVAPAPPQAEFPQNFIPHPEIPEADLARLLPIDFYNDMNEGLVVRQNIPRVPEIPEADLSGILPTDLYHDTNEGHGSSENVQFQGSSSAREIPKEIEDRIMSFGGTGLVFVLEKTLLKLDVQSSTTDQIKFSLPQNEIKNQFLSDAEERDLVSDEGGDAFLIGPSIHPDDVEEFNIKLTKWGSESYTFQGARWKDFVEMYGLAEGKKVQIWSFRRITTHSQIGTGTSQIGFELALVNEEQV